MRIGGVKAATKQYLGQEFEASRQRAIQRSLQVGRLVQKE